MAETSLPISLAETRAAAARARPYVRQTPLQDAPDPRTGAVLKLECLQVTGSFKVRGFFAAALSLSTADLRRGLLTVSAGNAALAAAYVAHTLGVPCRVVMYDTAPAPKIDGVRRWGATPVLLPRSEVLAWLAERRWETEPETFIHPFADPRVAAGHGGLALELLDQVPQLQRVLVPVGGGGLLVGIASPLKALRPDVEVVGVQSDGYDPWPRTFASGQPVTVTPGTIADGTTAPFDAAMYQRLGQVVDRWITVPELRVRAAVRALAMDVKVVAEGAGALAYAALDQFTPEPGTVAIISGGNIAPELLSELLAAPSHSQAG